MRALLPIMEYIGAGCVDLWHQEYFQEKGTRMFLVVRGTDQGRLANENEQYNFVLRMLAKVGCSTGHYRVMTYNDVWRAQQPEIQFRRALLLISVEVSGWKSIRRILQERSLNPIICASAFRNEMLEDFLIQQDIDFIPLHPYNPRIEINMRPFSPSLIPS